MKVIFFLYIVIITMTDKMVNLKIQYMDNYIMITFSSLKYGIMFYFK